MNGAATSGRYEREKMRLASVWGMFYLDYSINDLKDCKMAIEVAAESIMSKLGDEWKETKVYKALNEVAGEKKKNKSAKLKQIVQGEGFKKRAKTVRYSSKPTGYSGVTRPNPSRRTLSTPSTSAASNSRSVSTEPRAAKTLPATQAAQPTGKVAALRLAQTTLKRTNGALSAQPIQNSGDDEEDDTTPDLDLVDDPYTNLRKRPRNPDWATMGNQYIDGVTSVDSPFFVPNGEREYELRINNPGFELVYESLPSMTATGPLGSYKCTVDQSCSFICHEPHTPCGKEEIQKHCQKHAQKLEQENIMLKEASLSRKSVSYLQEFMDKKRREGERERLVEEKRQVINGRVVPKPIKRRYGV